MANKRKFEWLQNQRWLWLSAIALWVLGCVIIALGGGWWLGRKTAKKTGNEQSTMIAETPTVAAEIVLSTLIPPTDTPVPTNTATPKPTATPTATSGPSLGDRLLLPTATATPIPEGVIVFLSSRDHEGEMIKGGSPPYPPMDLYVMNPNGSNQIRLVNSEELGFTSNGYGDNPGWLTPYSKPYQVVLNSPSYPDYLVLDLRTLEVVDELSLEFSPVSKSDFGVNKISGYMPVWSSSGEIIISVLGGRQSDQSASKWNDLKGLYYFKNDKSYAQKITSGVGAGTDFWPTWSPDGEWVAFSHYYVSSASEGAGVWLVKSDGSDLHRIVDTMETRIIKWSPDGEKIAFQGRPFGTGQGDDLWISDAAGTNQQQLTFIGLNSKTVSSQSWSPDSHKIAYTISEFPSKTDIFIIDVNGGEPQKLTTKGYYNRNPIWLPISMDEILANAPTPSPPTPTPKPVALAPPAPSSCPSPGVQITSPRAGTRFTKRYNYILGTANINRFHHWKLEYSTNPNSGWQYLFERDYPVNNDKLMMLDASTVPRGPYGLRLTAVDETGNYPEPCVVWFINGY